LEGLEIRWEYNTNMNITDIAQYGIKCIHNAENRGQCWAVVNAEMEISCSIEDVISLMDSQVGFCSRN
jgi:hypothetical protein